MKNFSYEYSVVGLPRIDHVAIRLQVAAMIAYGANSPYTAPTHDQILLDLTSLPVNRVLGATRLLKAKFGHVFYDWSQAIGPLGFVVKVVGEGTGSVHAEIMPMTSGIFKYP